MSRLEASSGLQVGARGALYRAGMYQVRVLSRRLSIHLPKTAESTPVSLASSTVGNGWASRSSTHLRNKSTSTQMVNTGLTMG